MNKEASPYIVEHLNIGKSEEVCQKLGRRLCNGGLLGHGDAFVLRDPAGIRPAYYYKDEEVVVIASERPVIQTVFNVPFESVSEVSSGHAVIIKRMVGSMLHKFRNLLKKGLLL